MARVRVKHNSRGYAALLKDPAVVADVFERAARIAEATGDPDIVAESSTPVRKRARAAVIATRGDSDNRMIRSLDFGR